MSYAQTMTAQQQQAQQVGTVPPPSAPGVSGVLPGQQAVNTTRILSLTGFSKELKTRDIQSIFVDYEDDRGGYRIKWLDDTGCLIVFSDPITAKKAFLHLLANPHPLLQPSNTAATPAVNGSADGASTPDSASGSGSSTAPAAAQAAAAAPKLAPYTGEDAAQIIASVANRPRSRSIASANAASGGPSGHGRRLSSASGQTGYHARNASSASAVGPGGTPNGHQRSWGRASLGQNQMQAIIDEANSADAPAAAATTTTTSNNSPGAGAPSSSNDSPPSPTAANGGSLPNGGAIDWAKYQQQRERAVSSGSATFAPPVSPERGLGAHSPTRFRRATSRQ